MSTEHAEQRRQLFLRKFDNSLLQQSAQLRAIENDLNDTFRLSLANISVKCNSELKQDWFNALVAISKAVADLTGLLVAAANKIEQADFAAPHFLWKKFEDHAAELENACQKLGDPAFETFAEADQKNVQDCIVLFREYLLPSFVGHAMAYKVELQMIEQFAYRESDKMTQLILSRTAQNFTFEEAEQLEWEYLNALDELEGELKEEKDLWDGVLELLPGRAFK